MTATPSRRTVPRGRAGFRIDALFAALAMLAFAATPCQAQRSSSDEAVAPFSSAYFTVGTLLMDVSKLNPHFERLDLDVKDRPGYYTLSNDAYSVGLGAYGVVFRRFTIGAEFHSADVGQETSPTAKTNQLTTNYWMVKGGYAALTSWRFSLTPTLGIGTGSLKLTMRSRGGGAPLSPGQDWTFDEVIASPGSSSTMNGSYVMVQPGLSLEYLALNDDHDSIGLMIGLHLASAISPNRTTWTYGGRSVFGGPDVGPTGGMFRIVVGIGGFKLAAPR